MAALKSWFNQDFKFYFWIFKLLCKVLEYGKFFLNSSSLGLYNNANSLKMYSKYFSTLRLLNLAVSTKLNNKADASAPTSLKQNNEFYL